MSSKATIVLVHPELRRRFEDHRRHRRSAGDRQDPKPSGPTIPMAGALSNRVGLCVRIATTFHRFRIPTVRAFSDIVMSEIHDVFPKHESAQAWLRDQVRAVARSIRGRWPKELCANITSRNEFDFL
jgi:hypothetical protein